MILYVDYVGHSGRFLTGGVFLTHCWFVQHGRGRARARGHSVASLPCLSNSNVPVPLIVTLKHLLEHTA